MKIAHINSVYNKNFYVNKTQNIKKSDNQKSFGNGKNVILVKEGASIFSKLGLLHPIVILPHPPHPPCPITAIGAFIIESGLLSEKDNEKKEKDNTVDNQKD